MISSFKFFAVIASNHISPHGADCGSFKYVHNPIKRGKLRCLVTAAVPLHSSFGL